MYQKELDVALEAARLAGEYLRDEYTRFQAIPDAPADITTDADRQSQEIILKHIRKAFPTDSLCAEEATATLSEARADGKRQWIVDPIDGTRGFAQKNGEFAVMVALAEAGKAVVGVVLQPATQRITFAALGGGCWRQDGGEAKVACRVSSASTLKDATLIQTRSKKAGARSKWVEALSPAKVIESYSAGIKLVLVARGEGDVYLNFYDAFHDWDICAGHILVTEAGGRVTGLTGDELRYGTPGAWQKQGLLATNGKVHEEALKRLASVRAGV